MLHDINIYIMKIKQVQNMLQKGFDKDFFEIEWGKSNNCALSERQSLNIRKWK